LLIGYLLCGACGSLNRHCWFAAKVTPWKRGRI
jgi:hypothetical protein